MASASHVGVARQHQLRRPLGALQEAAEAHELPALVAPHRLLDQPEDEVGRAPDGAAEGVDAVARDALRRPVHQLQPRVVDPLPHLGGQAVADAAGVLARAAHAGGDAVGVVAAEGDEPGDAALVGPPVGEQEAVHVARHAHQRLPDDAPAGAVRRVALERRRLARLEQAGEVLGPLEVARGPVERLGDPCQHQRPRAVTRTAPRCPCCRRPGRSSRPATRRAGRPASARPGRPPASGRRRRTGAGRRGAP